MLPSNNVGAYPSGLEAVIDGWINESRSGRRGASKHYSDGAIALMATVQSLFNLAFAAKRRISKDF
jgi:hypothetical protein